MAELANLTYNITADIDSDVLSPIMKELQALRDEVSQIRGSQLIHEAWVDCQESKLGKKKAQDADGLLKKFTSLISETSLGQSVCCGIGEVASTRLITSCGDVVNTKGHIPHDAAGPFVIEGKLVYISKALIVQSGQVHGSVGEGVQSDNYKARTPGKADGSGWKLGADADFEVNSANTKVVIKDGVLKVFDNNNTLRTRVQL